VHQGCTLLRSQLSHYRDVVSSCTPDPFGMTDKFEASGNCAGLGLPMACQADTHGPRLLSAFRLRRLSACFAPKARYPRCRFTARGYNLTTTVIEERIVYDQAR